MMNLRKLSILLVSCWGLGCLAVTVQEISEKLLPTPKVILLKEGTEETCLPAVWETIVRAESSFTESNPEAYEIVIEKDKILFFGHTGYANATLEQLKRAFPQGIPLMKISDAPSMKWRGLHLDVSRHFFTVEEVKKFIAMMAHYKFNRLHLHLTDGPAWRIEIKKYPRLTEMGAWRVDKRKEGWNWRETEILEPSHYSAEKPRYGGFYTQAQMMELVNFALANGVMIVPEIEMPGHSFAAMMAYPELLACPTNRVSIDGLRGKDMVCAAKAIPFFVDVLMELVPLFPGAPIHIGGDEVMHSAWKDCPLCRAKMEQEHLPDTKALQTAFMREILTAVKGKIPYLIAWDEIYEDGLSDAKVACMVWRKPTLAYEAAKKGPVILCPYDWCYLDLYQGNPQTEPPAMAGSLTLEKVNSLDPLNPHFAKEVGYDGDLAAIRKNIWGIQGNLWSEYIMTMSQMEYMLWPRGFALSEIGWTGKPGEISDLKRKIRVQFLYLREQGYNFRPLER